ncbi:MAG: DsrE family protein [Actinomycetes bacterium]|nr:MAG: sulfur reduction protein DsrE [Actinomycetota bacterium]
MSSLVVKCTWGAERPETLLQAFTVAATAASAGVSVSLWLTGDATLHGLPGTEDVQIPHSPPLSQLRATILSAGTVTICSQCAARREITADDVIPGVRIAGAATFLEETLADGAKALVY